MNKTVFPKDFWLLDYQKQELIKDVFILITCPECEGTGKVDIVHECDCEFCWRNGDIFGEGNCPECMGVGRITRGKKR